MRFEVALLSIPLAFCLSLFALRASIATRSSKGVSLSLRTVVYFFSSVNPRFPSFCLYYIRKEADLQMCENVVGSSPEGSEKVAKKRSKILP